MAKTTTTYRLSEETLGKIKDLSATFDEKGGKVIERAINFLYANQAEAIEWESKMRIASLKAK
ncbi:hypothetical protein G8759_06210 [Spirosoma aureum]|uniref:Uncharacterized protein n=1 Tax=Spirosoma aureum TaxID=2692134 RepID=A0A6G9AIH3_9BACT|nr:hypothetical protein [Spirosoma aureum]QIP12250.1 hypothetical protein G8759_06210 [Spirosoma aureum]